MSIFIIIGVIIELPLLILIWFTDSFLSRVYLVSLFVAVPIILWIAPHFVHFLG